MIVDEVRPQLRGFGPKPRQQREHRPSDRSTMAERREHRRSNRSDLRDGRAHRSSNFADPTEVRAHRPSDRAEIAEGRLHRQSNHMGSEAGVQLSTQGSCYYTDQYLDHRFHPTCVIQQCDWRHSVVRSREFYAFGVIAALRAFKEARRQDRPAPTSILNLNEVTLFDGSDKEGLLVRHIQVAGTMTIWDELNESQRVYFGMTWFFSGHQESRPELTLSVDPEQYRFHVNDHVTKHAARFNGDHLEFGANSTTMEIATAFRELSRLTETL